MSLHPLVGLHLICLVLSARAGYFLVAHFGTYENTLHAYINLSNVSIRCCADPNMSPPNCTVPCNTTLDYCFMEFGTSNSVFNMDILSDCLGPPQTSQRLDHTDSINFTSPPLSAAGNTTPTSVTLRGDSWPGRIQFFVRSRAALNQAQYLVDYLVGNFRLSPGETVASQLTSVTIATNVSFTVSLTLSCEENFHGPNCTVYCRPVDSDELGHYSCLSDGSIQCLEGYWNESTNCTECVPAEGCPSSEESGSAVAIAVGVSVGCLAVLIATVLVAVVVLVALQRRRKSHDVDFEDKVSYEKPHNVYSHVQAPGSNPVYDDEGLGEHHPLGKSATAAGGPEHQLDNPLYTMEAQTEVYYSSADQPPQHDYDYASSGSRLPATGPLRRAPLTSPAPHKYDYASLPPEEGDLYDAPDMAPRPRPQQPQLTYDYAESPSGIVGSPTAVYDAPLLSDKPATTSHDYDYASTSNPAPNDLPPEASEHYEFGN